MMTSPIPRVLQQALVLCIGLLIAVLLAGSFAFLTLPRFSSRALAASLQQAVGTTCVQAPTVAHCMAQDPERQGCAADAVTLGRPVPIIENGFTIGSVERRWSATCQSAWGRVFDTRIGSQANMFVTIAGTTLFASPTFVNTHYRILYSSMVFAPSTTQQLPAITGTLGIDGIAKPPSATLPAITASGK